MKKENLARLIDHTILKPNSNIKDIERFCQEAIENKFWSVCINPDYVSLASKLVANSNVRVSSVVGFPFGANTSEVKLHEAKKAIEDGANEIDMVMNLGAFKSGNYENVKGEIEEIIDVAKNYGNIITKVIIETGFLNFKEKIVACKLVVKSGADFVKTSTGFNTQGATIKDVKLLRKIAGASFGVKASGGIRTYDQALKMVEAGANRIGTSSGVQIIKEYPITN
ncbi:deoxyribose-phosphate aldolase [Candidatus Bathyarchaeota archaeon]|nr:deoxyribose-phosphate aldolase [Candidatus Bathyarchaeota archaeon]